MPIDLTEKARLYNLNREIIHTKIKTNFLTKPLWRKLFWTTPRDSDEYKAGCMDIFKMHFPDLYDHLPRRD